MSEDVLIFELQKQGVINWERPEGIFVIYVCQNLVGQPILDHVSFSIENYENTRFIGWPIALANKSFNCYDM